MLQYCVSNADVQKEPVHPSARPIHKDNAAPVQLRSFYSPRASKPLHTTTPEDSKTAIPIQLKRSFEAKAGFSFDNVRVHYNSERPAMFQALAYTQGNQVYLGPGQERHLEHELVHVAQQRQGRVRPTAALHGAALNDSASLEQEADRGIVALSAYTQAPVSQGQPPIQRKVGMEYQTYQGTWNIKKLEKYSSCSLTQTAAFVEEDTTKIDQRISAYVVSAGRTTIYKDEASHYALTADGCDLEYITDAFDERTNKTSLMEAAQKAGTLHTKICNGIVEKPFTGVTKKIGQYYRVDIGDAIYYINSNGERMAHPQATVGIRFEQIPSLIAKLAKAPASSYLTGSTDSARRIKTALSGIAAAPQIKDTTATEPETPRTKAFIQLTEHYVQALQDTYKPAGSLRPVVSSLTALEKSINEALQKQGNFPDIAPVTNVNAAILAPIVKEAKTLEVAAANVKMPATTITTDLTALTVRKATNHQKAKDMAAEMKLYLPTNNIFIFKDNAAETAKNLNKALDRLPFKLASFMSRVTSLNSRHPISRETQTQINRFNQKITSLSAVISSMLARISAYELENQSMIRDLNTIITRMNTRRDAITNHVTSLLLELKPNKALENDKQAYLRKLFDQYSYFIITEYPFLSKLSSVKSKLQTAKENPTMHSEKYHKTILSMKTRTSFYDLFRLMSSAEQTAVEYHLKHKYNENTLIFDQKDTEYITLFDWLEELKKIDGSDLMAYELQNKNKLYDTDGYFKSFGVTRSTDIGQDIPAQAGRPAQLVEGALLELRKLKSNVLPSKWGEAAGAIADLAVAVNTAT